MTELLAVALGLLFAYAIYISTQSARKANRTGDHLDAGRRLPAWTYIFAGSGMVFASFNPYDQLRLVAIYGFQANHLALGLVLVTLCATLFQKRVWLAARITGTGTVGDALGAHYGSVSIRLYLLVVLFLFAVPFPAYLLSEAGELIAFATAGDVTRMAAISSLAVLLFVASALGGWRAVVYWSAALSFLVLVLMFFVTGFSAALSDEIALLNKGFMAGEGVLTDAIPGVIQFPSGIGAELPVGGLWTTVAILSFAISAVGIVLSPGFAFLGLTTRVKSGFAFCQVWVTAGLFAGALLLFAPFIGAEMTSGGTDALGPIMTRLGGIDQLAAICFVLMLAASLFIAIALFAASGASIFTIELLDRYVIPRMSDRERRLAARIMLAVIYALAALLAGFLPMMTAAITPLAFSLSAQLFPAYLGLCWLPWMSRSAVLAGLILGTIVVFFTEPPGLILFNGLFAELPWGRWPLTIHSAAWGLAVNLAACLLVAIFTRKGHERERRDALHAIFRRDHRMNFGGRASRGAKWSITLLWVFFALGPGAILGNTFFSKPIFTGANITVGAPSLWVWQIAFWIFGIMIVWWLAYRNRMSIISTETLREGELVTARPTLDGSLQPVWIGRLVTRIAGRQNPTMQGM
jgi:solute:Na+ symporter, SSS family